MKIVPMLVIANLNDELRIKDKMTYGYKNDEICEECKYEKLDECNNCYNHMEFYRKQKLIEKLKERVENEI